MLPRASFAAGFLVSILLSACTTSGLAPTGSTSSASTATPPPPSVVSATPTPTWSAAQASAIQAVEDYRTASQQIGSMPSDFTEAQMKTALKKVAGPEVVKANVASYLSLKKRGLRYDGTTSVLSTIASDPSDVGYGVEVVVTHCIDQRGIKLVDKAGVEVSLGSAADLPASHAVYLETATRDHFTPSPLSYFQRMFTELLAEDAGRIRLYLAHHEGDLVASTLSAPVGAHA